MDLVKLTEGLNAAADKYFDRDVLNFIGGDLAQVVSEAAKKYAPSGKIAILYSRKDYLSYGVDVAKNLNGAGLGIVNVILPERKINDVKELCKLFDLPEDTRLVVAASGDFFGAAAYYANVKRIRAVQYVRTPSDIEELTPVRLIKMGDKVDFLRLDAPLTVGVSDKFSLSDVAELFANTESKLTALIDYRVQCAAGFCSFDKKSYDLLKTSVQETFKIFDKKLSERTDFAVESALKCVIADFSAKGKLVRSSSLGCFDYLADSPRSGYASIMALKCYLEIYYAFFNKDYADMLDYPDYNARAETLSALTGLDEKFFVEGFVGQLSRLKDKNKGVDKIASGLKKEITDLKTAVKKIENVYVALGGKKQPDGWGVRAAVKYSGDLPWALNGMSIIREAGLTEKL